MDFFLHSFHYEWERAGAGAFYTEYDLALEQRIYRDNVRSASVPCVEQKKSNRIEKADRRLIMYDSRR